MNQLKTIDQTCNTIIDNEILYKTNYTKEEVVARLMDWSSLARWRANEVAEVVMIELNKIR
tara:strand:+ start:198 stop:380 length:183 start_codon:yes stop_codon:yes gene_type:complete